MAQDIRDDRRNIRFVGIRKKSLAWQYRFPHRLQSLQEWQRRFNLNPSSESVVRRWSPRVEWPLRREEHQLRPKWGTLARVIIHLVLRCLYPQYVMFVYETSAISKDLATHPQLQSEHRSNRMANELGNPLDKRQGCWLRQPWMKDTPNGFPLYSWAISSILIPH